MSLTLIVIPTDKSDKKTLESFTEFLLSVIHLKEGESFNVPVQTKWKMFLYAGEYISEDIRKALPEYLLQGDSFDAFEMFRRSPKGYSISPRLFKGEIQVEEHSLMPVFFDSMKVTPMLDGFIEND